MGHKVHPILFRIGIVKNWQSRWFNRKHYPVFLEQDFYIKKYIQKELSKAAVESITITRPGNSINITVRTARPGLVIGRGGKRLEELQTGLAKVLRKLERKKKTNAENREEQPKLSIKLEIEEIRRPESYARLVAKNIAEQIERRMPFRRVMKQSIEKVIQQKDVEGVKVMVSGRLAGADIARSEHLSKGKIPLQTLRANIDYAQENANTTYGVIGVKVWIYKGEVFGDEDKK